MAVKSTTIFLFVVLLGTIHAQEPACGGGLPRGLFFVHRPLGPNPYRALHPGDKQQECAALQPGGGVQVQLDGTDVAWYSTSPDVATIDANGTITAVGPGMAQMVAYYKHGTYPDGTPLGWSSFVVRVEQPLDIRRLQPSPPLHLPVLVRPPAPEPPGLFEMPKMPPQRDDDFNVPMG